MNCHNNKSTAESTSKYAAAKMLAEAHSGLEPTLDHEIIEEKQEITTFADEGTVRVQNEVLPFNPTAQQAIQDVDTQGIVNFLQRPVQLRNFEWRSTTSALTPLFSIPLPLTWLNIKMIADKISGFRYAKMNLNLRVQINAQPANAGYLLLVYEPLKQQLTKNATSTLSLQGLTGYPNVKMDIANTTAAEMTIPFTATISHFDMLNGVGTMGYFSVYVYSPMTGSDFVDGTVYGWASDVQLDTPTGLPPLLSPAMLAQAHAGDIREPKMKSKSKEERKEPGIVEKVAGAVKEVAGVVSFVPEIGPIAKAVEWGADLVGNVASFFGWSKPVDFSQATKVVTAFQQNSANSDGTCQGKALSLLSNNSTQIPTDIFGTEEDEMAFSTIMKRPTFIDSFSIADDQRQGEILWLWPVDPMSCKKRIYNDPAVTPYLPQHMVCLNNFVSLCSTTCRYWRGSLNYKFHFVRSPLHSARLRVTFIPGATENTDLSKVDFDMCHSTIYDLRESSDFEFNVPYKWNTVWKTLDGTFGTTSTGLTPNTPTGLVVVSVVNVLRRPTIAAPKIECVVEITAGDDFALAVPRIQRTILVTDKEALDNTFPATRPVAHSGEISELAVGEVVTGFRQLLKRYEPLIHPTQDEDLEPYHSLFRSEQLVNEFTTYWDIASSMYRFLSGSVNIVLNGTDQFATVELAPPTDHNSNVGARATAFKTNLEPSLELRVPFYQPVRAIPTDVGAPKFSTMETKSDFKEVPYNNGSHLRIRPFSKDSVLCWRSIGEDFSFGYLIGPCQTLVYYASQTQCKVGWRESVLGLQGSMEAHLDAAKANGWETFRKQVLTDLGITVTLDGQVPVEVQSLLTGEIDFLKVWNFKDNTGPQLMKTMLQNIVAVYDRICASA